MWTISVFQMYWFSKISLWNLGQVCKIFTSHILKAESLHFLHSETQKVFTFRVKKPRKWKLLPYVHYAESESKFANISVKLWQKSKIFYRAKIEPGGYSFMDKPEFKNLCCSPLKTEKQFFLVWKQTEKPLLTKPQSVAHFNMRLVIHLQVPILTIN